MTGIILGLELEDRVVGEITVIPTKVLSSRSLKATLNSTQFQPKPDPSSSSLSSHLTGRSFVD